MQDGVFVPHVRAGVEPLEEEVVHILVRSSGRVRRRHRRLHLINQGRHSDLRPVSSVDAF